MNFLAHSYLSYSDGQITGNLLEDFVKNSERKNYPSEIKKGILLHRSIDTFTDAHPEISEAKKIFSQKVRLYAGAFVDISMDYFLANDHNIKSPNEWKDHSNIVYAALNNHHEWLPQRFQEILPNMESNDWLYNYREYRGIQNAFNHLKRKAKYLDEDLDVFELFLKNEDRLREHYQSFFPDLEAFTKEENLKT